ncbi:outer membrane efflux protein [Gottschalkia acidurici 9a]|uniref:Outer membrane efflux protein n=1 Tax=Gottschalkia acidurici (strain ATCC 7906 / DSM 604 / BCRC 14475 / CIP 104303 / KCTC 5404 / NCIMB 10678 / 9a) TaxID=1128398 RepID=K0AXD9_GOTA9|nr:TolC family protein [Gottschalkia acidurici]AFS77385.1 outer membrane efflux protein [Gottschalkia acidurici 9a]
MKAKRVIAITVLALSLSGSVTLAYAEQDNVKVESSKKGVVELTLNKAIEEALTNNPTIEQSKLGVEQAQVNFEETRSLMRKNRRLINDDKERSLEYLKGVKLLEITSDFSLVNAERNHNATIENIKCDIEEQYFRLLQAEKLTEINKNNIDLSKELYNISKKKLDLGVTTKQEVLSSELNQINAQNDYDQSVKNLKNAKMLFNTKLGYDVLQDTKLTDELKYKEFKVESIDDAVNKALENRNEIKAAEFNYELEKFNMEVTKGEYANITYKYREQEVKLEKAKQSFEDAKKNIEMEVRSTYLEMLQKEEEIKKGQKSLELAKEGLRLSKLSYEAGVGVFTDLEKAQNTLMQAELGLYNSILEYNLAVLKFDEVTGIGRSITSAPSI